MKRIFLFTTLFALALSASAQRFKKLVWSDEFNTAGKPSAKKWGYEKGYLRNNELQWYSDSNATVRNGHLVIELRKEAPLPGDTAGRITSASLTTQGKADWTYGRFEVRARIPSSLGTWPAIWMLPTDIDKTGWPDGGEIDIMEHVGFDSTRIHTNIHTKAYNHVLKTNKGKATKAGKPYKDFHVYAVEWTKEKLDFFMDRKLLFTYRNEGTGDAVWPYNKPFYLILNLAYGGAWGGQQGVNNSRLPQRFLIDWVRVYQ